MDKKIVLPILALIAGATGFGLRKIELATAFVAETGLPIEGAPVSIALIVLSIVMGIVFFALSPGKQSTQVADYHEAFYPHQSPLYLLGGVVAAFVVLASGLLLVYQSTTTTPLPMTYLILGVASIITALALLIVVKTTKSEEKPKGYVTALLLPAFTACLWLVVDYQLQAANPVLLDYIYSLLAIVSILLALYQMVGFSFEKPKVRGMCVCSLFGVYCTYVTMADAHQLWEYLLLGGIALFLLVHTVALLANVAPKATKAQPNQEN